jgi:hypothetical protein
MRPLRDSRKIREYLVKPVHDAHHYPFGLRILWGIAAKYPRRPGELAVQTKHATEQARQTEIDRASRSAGVGATQCYDRHNGQDE